MKIFALSDIHIDYTRNRKWLMDLSRADYQQDILILAGDISDNAERIEQCFKQLSNCFRQVHFVPGNHDLWVKKRDAMTSIDKFYAITRIANDYGIATTPCQFGELTIVPLLGWYDFSFGHCSEYLQERWMDFHTCQWGEAFDELTAFSVREKAITEFFLSLNEPWLSCSSEMIISFSHFLPRIDLMPDFIPAIHQKLYPILGTDALDRQVRQLGSCIHVYGHSHFNRHIDLDGVTYINNAYGNPGEERITSKMLLCVHELDENI